MTNSRAGRDCSSRDRWAWEAGYGPGPRFDADPGGGNGAIVDVKSGGDKDIMPNFKRKWLLCGGH